MLGKTKKEMSAHRNSTSPHSELRPLGVSVDDSAVFIEDTIDKSTAQCISNSTSAGAILTPQRLPVNSTHVDVTEYDSENIGTVSSGVKGRLSGSMSHDNSSTSCRLSFGKSPTPKASRTSTSLRAPSNSHSTSCTRGSTKKESDSPNPVPMVPLSDLEYVERERNRFQKMYEHQKVLYEDMSEKYTETYNNYQDKIVEVVALSTRNEESKRFIRQLKKEMSENRTRVMDIQNRALEDTRQERFTKERYEQILDEQALKYEEAIERYECKIAGYDTLLKDVTTIRGNDDKIHISQLDSLLKASYAKNSALFNDLLRQSKQMDIVYSGKSAVEKELELCRRDKKELENALFEERRQMMKETDRYVEQVEEQQQSIINLRQMLIRAMDHSYCDSSEDECASDNSDSFFNEVNHDETSPQIMVKSAKDVVPTTIGEPSSATKENTPKIPAKEKSRPLLASLIRSKGTSEAAESTRRPGEPYLIQRPSSGETNRRALVEVKKSPSAESSTEIRSVPPKLPRKELPLREKESLLNKPKEGEKAAAGLSESKRQVTAHPKTSKVFEKSKQKYIKTETEDDENDDHPRLMHVHQSDANKENA
ncbi:hypothetical protein AGDE_14823 [Angomonas deanei]|nr:hypothetical protein AGDE_14823 [Angomonas deanei]|eukprot:EPY20156.1 hypothetical protein AGDE_14823 [Angomonas deanei]